jgi:hypothetical protein
MRYEALTEFTGSETVTRQTSDVYGFDIAGTPPLGVSR